MRYFYDFYVIKLGINQKMKSLLFLNTEFIVSTIIIYNGYNKKYFKKLVFLTVALFSTGYWTIFRHFSALTSITEISVTKYHLKF